MNESTKTKKALRGSLFALFLCIVLLIGTTFAWFTDTASTGVNQIVSGKLDIDIIGATSDNHVEKLNFTKTPDAENEEILWEPGCRYLTEGFRIANKGNLALKWKAEINNDNIVDGKVSEDAKDGKSLLDVIDFYVVKSTDENAEAVAIEDFIGNLKKTETSGVYYIKGVMQTTAGNEYQNLTLDGITITVYATQDTVESDSFNNTYDENAGYPVGNYADMKKAFADGGSIAINDNITADATKTATSDRMTIKAPTTLYLGATYTVPGELEASSNWAALYVNSDLTINASSNGGINCLDKTDPNASYVGGPYVAHINGKDITVTVNGGKYYGGCTIFNVQQGTLIVNDGFFQVAPDTGTKDYRYTLNCIDANYNDGSAKIIVKGGTYVNFDPSNNAAEGAGTNFVADGYEVVSETQSNGDVWYTVVKK